MERSTRLKRRRHGGTHFIMLSQRMTFTNPLAFVRPPLVFWGGVGVLGGDPGGDLHTSCFRGPGSRSLKKVSGKATLVM